MEYLEIFRKESVEALLKKASQKGLALKEEDLYTFEGINAFAEVYGDKERATSFVPIVVKKMLAKVYDPGCSWQVSHTWNGNTCTGVASFVLSNGSKFVRTKELIRDDCNIYVALSDEKRSTVCAALAEGSALALAIGDAVMPWYSESERDLTYLDIEFAKEALEVKDCKEIQKTGHPNEQTDLPKRFVEKLDKVPEASDKAAGSQESQKPTNVPASSFRMTETAPSTLKTDGAGAVSKAPFLSAPTATTVPPAAVNAPISMTLEQAKQVLCSYGNYKGKTLGYLMENVPAALPWMNKAQGGTDEEKVAVALLIAATKH